MRTIEKLFSKVEFMHIFCDMDPEESYGKFR